MKTENKEAGMVIIPGSIDRSNLKRNRYTLSLLQEASRINLLTIQEIKEMLEQVMHLLRDLIIRYTKGDSSSVAVDTAESLLNSIMYTIDAYAVSCGNPEEAAEALKTTGMEEAYRRGTAQVSRWLKEAKELYGTVRKNMLDIGVESYRQTIYEAIPSFFKGYGMIFDSHNTAAAIDYPLAFDDVRDAGVLYIRNYLEHLKIENDFCSRFSLRDIENLLDNYGAMMRVNYRIELINLFELVFNNSVLSKMAGNKSNSLRISGHSLEELDGRLKAMSAEAAEAFVKKAAEKLLHDLNIIEPEIIGYVGRYRPIFTRRVRNAVKNGSLGSIAVIEKEGGRKAASGIFTEGERMSGIDYTFLVKKVTESRKTGEKIKLIKRKIGSLHDFIDILNADCLFGGEFEELFETLGEQEIAVLSKVVFYEELRDGFKGLEPLIGSKKYFEYEWQTEFAGFLRKLSKSDKSGKSGRSRIDSIEKYLDEIEYEEIRFD